MSSDDRMTLMGGCELPARVQSSLNIVESGPLYQNLVLPCEFFFFPTLAMYYINEFGFLIINLIIGF